MKNTKSWFKMSPPTYDPDLIVDEYALLETLKDSDTGETWEVQYIGEKTEQEIREEFSGEHPGW
jgi:hypothetical protein